MRSFLLAIEPSGSILAIINVPKEVLDVEPYVRGYFKVKEIIFAKGEWKGLKVGEKLNASDFDILPDWSETTSREQLIHIIFSELIQ